ncbi:hypothetical protein E2320_006503 [Naja naja]|nr:hypothetical protein E2320_006503 [Naja naja]
MSCYGLRSGKEVQKTPAFSPLERQKKIQPACKLSPWREREQGRGVCVCVCVCVCARLFLPPSLTHTHKHTPSPGFVYPCVLNFLSNETLLITVAFPLNSLQISPFFFAFSKVRMCFGEGEKEIKGGRKEVKRILGRGGFASLSIVTRCLIFHPSKAASLQIFVRVSTLHKSFLKISLLVLRSFFLSLFFNLVQIFTRPGKGRQQTPPPTQKS